MKKLIHSKGVKTLNKKEQQNLKGGTTYDEAMGHCIVNGEKILVKSDF